MVDARSGPRARAGERVSRTARPHAPRPTPPHAGRGLVPTPAAPAPPHAAAKHPSLTPTTPQLAEYRAGKAPFPSVRVSPGFIIDFAGKELAALAGKADPGEATADGGGSGSGGAGGAGGLAAAPVASGQLDHVCLCLEDGADMDAAAARLAAAGAPPRPQFDGTVVQRFGARGGAKSVYIETPEGVTLELRSYPSAAGLAT